ncbi:Replication factor C subunit 5 isoform 2 [Schistosoma japonicum]|uniref:Replication factor C subunit 5 isoform 2 n=2 Tax=Schistosoma japonicum TaxID=6182 RepID=A0A4Z2DJQ6_SCHJA|nr:Replication factor C subunit 5 [Schistosoma japonicum]TNN16719.1 Replication factor C subunit 5 isoform 2 [Schistosoma japonicum]
MEIPWIEKYRPSSIEDLISHDDISKTIKRFIDNDKLPHLLFYGPPGTGKTSTILAAAKRLYSRQFASMVLELNASDDRGIDIVREQVLSFASTKTLFAGKFKLVILDEADSMTKDAQNALRRIIEKFTENTRFCLICNYLSKIIPAIQSRCTKFRFAPLKFNDVNLCLRKIATNEGVTLTDDGVKAIYQFASGDMRKSINLLQSTSMSSKTVDGPSVYACVAYPSPDEIRSLLDHLLNEPISTAYHITLPDAIRCDLLIALSDIEHRMSQGASERLQLGAFISAFTRAKVALEAKVC